MRLSERRSRALHVPKRHKAKILRAACVVRLREVDVCDLPELREDVTQLNATNGRERIEARRQVRSRQAGEGDSEQTVRTNSKTQVQS